jgi:hypothetical protein
MMGFFHLVAPKTSINEEVISCELNLKISNNTIESRFIPPVGYSRNIHKGSFQEYLISLPLKQYGEKVFTYNGIEKPMENVYCSVIDMDLDPVNLQQCADAVMRLRGEYLYSKKQYDKIHFEYLSDGKPRYFIDFAKSDTSYKNFRKYMKEVFNRANTRSLKNELVPVMDKNDIQAGDVFIMAGNPYGHAILVIDVVENDKGEKQFLLAQSYMPAQDTQILINPSCPNNSPWYNMNTTAIETPEWNFEWSALHRFPQEKA